MRASQSVASVRIKCANASGGNRLLLLLLLDHQHRVEQVRRELKPLSHYFCLPNTNNITAAREKEAEEEEEEKKKRKADRHTKGPALRVSHAAAAAD